MIEHLTQSAVPLPTREQNNVPVVMISSKAYLPYTCVALSSLLRCGMEERFYDIFLLHSQEFSDIDEEYLKKITDCRGNCRLRLIRLHEMVDLPSYAEGHISVETYARLLIPSLMCKFQDVIYLDSDLIVCRDVADLLKEEASPETALSGVIDLDVIGQYHGPELSMRYYLDKKLKLQYPDRYLQGGVLVFHIAAFRDCFGDSLLPYLGRNCRLRYFDQDILNCLCNDKVHLLDLRWNVVSDCDEYRISHIITHAPSELYQAYLKSREAPWIVHYSGYRKPWEYYGEDLSDYFYAAARTAGLETLIPMEQIKRNGGRFRKQFGETLLPRQSLRREWVKRIYFAWKYHGINYQKDR